MKQRAIALVTIALLLSMIPSMSFALMAFDQDFEGLSQSDTGALTADGWKVFANVFGPGGDYWYGYGTFDAPNDGGGFCQITLEQGIDLQCIAIFSDYNNVDHAQGAIIESNVFQEQTVTSEDVGETFTFDFSAKMGNLEGVSTALAFIKTLDPNNGWAMTNFITVDMTAIGTDWAEYSVALAIDESLVGQVFQFGFSNNATYYEGSGVFYDNVTFSGEGTVATQEMSFDGVKSLYR